MLIYCKMSIRYLFMRFRPIAVNIFVFRTFHSFIYNLRLFVYQRLLADAEHTGKQLFNHADFVEGAVVVVVISPFSLPSACAMFAECRHSHQQHNIIPTNVKPGFYTVELNKTVWIIPECYQKLNPVGTGAYGTVCSAECVTTGDRVAIKKFTRPFQSPIHAKRTHRELRLLRLMSHENVIDLYDVFTPDQHAATLNDVYFVSILMGADLSNILKIQRLSDDHIQFLVYQILRALKYIHSAGIIHRDLKPSNIAVNEDCELKILDFGLARHADQEMTGYVATRWYRAPEIMLNWMHYTQTVDIWSVGCIMAELITGRTLFPGADHIDQLTRIMSICGTPNDEFLRKISSEEARNYIRNMTRMERKDFKKIFIGATPEAVDFLEKTLNLDPDYRPTAEHAMEHVYFKQYHDPNDEPTADGHIEVDIEQDMSIDQWRQMIWAEIEAFQLQQHEKRQQQQQQLAVAEQYSDN